MNYTKHLRVLAFGLTATFLFLINPKQQDIQAQDDGPFVSQQQYERWQEELSNWGRWGPDDELGALNLITAEKRREAASLVKSGVTVSLARTADMVESIDNPCPIEWEMINASPGGASDRIIYRCIHGAGTTHIDGFAHRFFDRIC